MTVPAMLAVRDWALCVLSGKGVPSVPELSLPAMRAVLDRERCALPLAGRLGSAVPPAIQEQALRDAQVTLIRQAPLAELGRLGQERGFPVVALKSAAHATRVPSLDLDVLVPQAQLAQTIDYLERQGYRSGSGYLDTMEIHNVHLPARGRPGDLMVEVHFDVGDGLPVDDRMWGNLRPLASHSGIFRLPAERQAWHVLWHSVVVHTHRRGQVGDLLLIAEALDELDPPGRAWLEAQVRGHSGAVPLGRALRMADALRIGTTPTDEFQAVAAAQYRLRTSRLFGRRPARAAKQLEAQWFGLVEGEGVARLWRRLVLTEGSKSARPWLYALERSLPTVTRAARTALRAAVFGLTLPIAILMSRVTRADVRRGSAMAADG